MISDRQRLNYLIDRGDTAELRSMLETPQSKKADAGSEDRFRCRDIIDAAIKAEENTNG
jgi:hypothetical protein